MKAIVQRVSRGRVTVEGVESGAIGPGLVVLLGIKGGDTEAEARYLAEKTAGLRVFADAQDKMNLSVMDTGGSLLVIPQFTLYADSRKGNRPSFVKAAGPAEAEHLYGVYVGHLRRILSPAKVATGVFRAHMVVEILNEGPVTIELNSDGRSDA